MRKSSLANNANEFIPDKDVTEKLDDGREIQVAVKGVPMERTTAVRQGLTDPATPAEAALAPGEKSPAELHNEAIAKKRGVEATENKMLKDEPENKAAAKKEKEKEK